MRSETGAAASGLAFSVALLWSVHPLQTESVTYVVQRAEILGGLLYVATLYGVARCAVAPGGRSLAWAGAAVLSCWLGMAAKETLATAPVLALAMDRIFFARSWRELWRARSRLHLALASGWIVLACLIVAASGRNRTVGFDLGTAWWQYALTQPYYVCRYLFLTLWPGPLTLDYGRYQAATPGEVLPYLAIVAALAGAALFVLRRAPTAGFPGLWFFVILAPTSSVVPIVTQTGAEHRMYLPLAGVVAALVIGPYVWMRRRLRPAGILRFAGIALVAIAAVALGARTVARNLDYRSAVSIWGSSVAHWPRNPRAQVSFGVALADEGRPAEAIPHFERALELEPGNVDAEVELATALARTGKREEAIDRLETLLRRRPDVAEGHNNLGSMLLLEARVDEAIRSFEAAIREDPDLAEAFHNAGRALSHAGRHVEAIPRFERARELRADDVPTQIGLADALARVGRPDEAIDRLEEALRLEPGSAPAHGALGSLLSSAGRTSEAVAHYEESLRIEPDQAELLNNLAWIRATDPDPGTRDPDEALRLARRAVSLPGGRSASALDTLAAAEAAAGLFDDAAGSAEAALELARAEGRAELAAQIALHLARYRAGQAYAPR